MTTSDAVDIRDALLPLAHALHSTPSSHVLLVGAGVSVAAGVESAWGVLTSLIEDIARPRGVVFEATESSGPGEAAIAWYKEEFGKAPSYESILAELGPTQTERQRLLRRFFEPRLDDPSSEPRQPTSAHRSIANLMRSGNLRIVVTLNFDTLIEQAVRDLGMEPTVIASENDLKGMAPLHTQDALIVHLHGQYLSPTTMRNTLDELSTYSEVEEAFLERVFNEYGVVAVGWSATYDPALCEILARTSCSHFSSYWIEPGTLSEVAEGLRIRRRMQFIHGNADLSLGSLSDSVTALRDTSKRHPDSMSTAMATAKRQLSGDRVAIQLQDTLNAEFSRVRSVEGLSDAALGRLPEPDYAPLLRQLESETMVASGLIAVVSHWGTSTTDTNVISEIERSARVMPAGGLTKILRLPQLPALLWATTASVAGASAGRWELVRKVLVDTNISSPDMRTGPVATMLRRSSLELDRPLSYPFDLLEPIFVEHLGLTQAAWIDAWETAEIIRLCTDLMQSRRGDITEVAEDIENTARDNPDVAAEERSSVVADLAKSFHVSPVHIRVREERPEAYLPPTGTRLLSDMIRTGDQHPLVAAHVISASGFESRITLEAVNQAVAIRGSSAAWATLPHSGGPVPSYIWLDSGEVPAQAI